MPSNLSAASPAGVLQSMTFTAFRESRVFPLLTQSYHDNTIERALITDGVNPAVSLKTWDLSARLTSTNLDTLRTFWEAKNGGLTPFYWYNPTEPQIGRAYGSNYDPTGIAIYGRYVVVFGNVHWGQVVDKARTDVTFQLVQVA